MGPIINTILGAGIKLLCNLINSWLEQKRQDQMMLAAKDQAMMDAIIRNQREEAKDPFVKITSTLFDRRFFFIPAYTAAQAPLPQASVIPAPLSQTRI